MLYGSICFIEALLDIIAFDGIGNSATAFLLFQIGSGADLIAPRGRLLLQYNDLAITEDGRYDGPELTWS